MYFLYPPQRTASHINTVFPPSVREKKKKNGGKRREGREVDKPKIIIFVPCDLKWNEDGKMKRMWRKIKYNKQNSRQWREAKRPILSLSFCLPLRTVSAPEARLDWSHTDLRGIGGNAGSPERLASKASSPFLPSKGGLRRIFRGLVDFRGASSSSPWGDSFSLSPCQFLSSISPVSSL